MNITPGFQARRPRHLLRRCTTALSITLSAAAGVTATLGATGAAQAQSGPSWHVLVYAVNDSSSDLPIGLDLDEMVAASRSGVTFTVFVDSSDLTVYPSSQFVTETAEAVVLEVAAGAITVTDNLGELDSGSPDTLAWFVATGLQRHPTERSALVVWDHGDGWRGIAVDENVTADGRTTASNSIDSAELGQAIETGLAAAGRSQFDLLILDACLMATIDMVSETTGGASYLIASEELVAGVGLDYDAFEILATSPGADAVTIFDTLATGFVRDIERDNAAFTDMITLSLTDLNQASALEQAIAAFVQAAVVDVAANPAPYMAAADAGVRYGVNDGEWRGYLDLGEFVARLDGVGPAVAAARDTLLATIDAAVLSKVDSPSYATSTGLTMYLPEIGEYDFRYDQKPAAQLWRPFIDAFFNAQAGVVLETDIGFTAAAVGIEAGAQGGYVVGAPVTANFVGSVQLLAGLPDASGNLNYFQATAGEVAGGRAVATLPPTMTTISDGTNSAVPFTRFSSQGGVPHASAQFVLQRQDGTTATLHWDRAAEASTGPFTIIDPNGTIVGYTPLPGDVAYPIVLVQRPGATEPEHVATTPALDLNATWTVSDGSLTAGQQVFVQLQLIDAAGAPVDALDGYVTIGQ